MFLYKTPKYQEFFHFFHLLQCQTPNAWHKEKEERLSEPVLLLPFFSSLIVNTLLQALVISRAGYQKNLLTRFHSSMYDAEHVAHTCINSFPCTTLSNFYIHSLKQSIYQKQTLCVCVYICTYVYIYIKYTLNK